MNFTQPWKFHNPAQIISALGAVKELPGLVPDGKGLLITSPGFTRRGLTARILDLFELGQIVVVDTVEPNPDIEAVEACRRELKGQNFQFVIGVGGGSVLDTAKALSLLLKLDDQLFTLREHFSGKFALPDTKPLMMVAVPTTAGTGSEVTPFATIWDLKAAKKYSLAGENLFPAVALLDAGLTTTLPRDITVITGLDALSHALESVWNRNANPVSLSFAAGAISLVLETLPRLVHDLVNIDLRIKMLTGSLFGGLCISSTRTALAHSMSYPITASLGVPHGLACGFTLPALFEFNAKEDDGRFEELARLTGYSGLAEMIEAVSVFFEQLGIDDMVSGYGLTEKKLADLAKDMFTPGRADNNLRKVALEDVETVLVKSVQGSRKN